MDPFAFENIDIYEGLDLNEPLTAQDDEEFQRLLAGIPELASTADVVTEQEQAFREQDIHNVLDRSVPLANNDSANTLQQVESHSLVTSEDMDCINTWILDNLDSDGQWLQDYTASQAIDVSKHIQTAEREAAQTALANNVPVAYMYGDNISGKPAATHQHTDTNPQPMIPISSLLSPAPTQTDFAVLPLPPSDDAAYHPHLGWYVRSTKDDTAAKYSTEVGGYIIPLRGQRFVNTQELYARDVPSDAPAMPRGQLHNLTGRKRPREEDRSTTASIQRQQPQLQPAIPPVSRPQRTVFPYDIRGHPLQQKHPKTYQIVKDCKCDNINVPDRPPNPFLCFRRKFCRETDIKDNNKISEAAGHAWRRLTPAERRPYEEEANTLKALLYQRNPGYKYVPRAGNIVKFGFKDCYCGAYQLNMEALERDRERERYAKSRHIQQAPQTPAYLEPQYAYSPIAGPSTWMRGALPPPASILPSQRLEDEEPAAKRFRAADGSGVVALPDM